MLYFQLENITLLIWTIGQIWFREIQINDGKTI